MANSVPQQKIEFTLTTVERGKMTVTIVDRINVDDVFLHLVDREIYKLMTGTDSGDTVNQLFKDFLLKENFTAGQN